MCHRCGKHAERCAVGAVVQSFSACAHTSSLLQLAMVLLAKPGAVWSVLCVVSNCVCRVNKAGSMRMACANSLLISYTTNSFPEDYVPTVFDNYSVRYLLCTHAISLSPYPAMCTCFDPMRHLTP